MEHIIFFPLEWMEIPSKLKTFSLEVGFQERTKVIKQSLGVLTKYNYFREAEEKPF